MASRPGAMMSVNLAEDQVAEYLESVGLSSASASSIHIACANSPANVTLSGDEEAIDSLKESLTKDSIFAQKLKTGVAYHSPVMHKIVSEYRDLMGSLESRTPMGTSAIRMVSSVTGKIVTPSTLSSPEYWIENLVSPVRFSNAIKALVQSASGLSSDIGDIIEVGPHCALQRPIQDTLKAMGPGARNIKYSALLIRQKPPLQTLLQTLGSLFCRGHAVSVITVNRQDRDGADAHPIPFLVDCPEYPFDHSITYWSESWLSKDLRLRDPVQNDILGPRFYDNPYVLRWRTLLSIASMPWVKDHVVSLYYQLFLFLLSRG